MFAFFKNLHINLNVAIEKRKNLNATMNREAISVQDIDFFDVAIDKNSDENSEKINDTFSERSRTISDTNIERNKIFDDVENEKIIDRNDEKNKNIDYFATNFDFEICAKNETIDC